MLVLFSAGNLVCVSCTVVFYFFWIFLFNMVSESDFFVFFNTWFFFVGVVQVGVFGCGFVFYVKGYLMFPGFLASNV